MGYGCIICDECLEIPAPDYEQSDQDAARIAQLEEPGPSVVAGPRGRRSSTRGRGRGQSSRSSTPKGKVIREIARTDVVVTPCGHLFHQTCIARWIKDKDTMNCPACRKSCTAGKLVRTFPSVVLYHPAIDEDFKCKQDQPGTSKQKVPMPSSSGNRPEQLRSSGPTSLSHSPVVVQAVVEVQDDEDTNIQIVNHNNNRNSQPNNCSRPTCVDREMIRQTLEQDFDDLQNRYTNAIDDNNIKQAQLQSCEERIKALEDTVEKLRKEKEELKGRIGTTSMLVKKRLPTTSANDGQEHQPPKRRRANGKGNDDNPQSAAN